MATMIDVVTVPPTVQEGIMAVETTGSCKPGLKFALHPVRHAARLFKEERSSADNVAQAPRVPAAVVQRRFRTARVFVRRVANLPDRVTIRSLQVPTTFARCLSS